MKRMEMIEEILIAIGIVAITVVGLLIGGMIYIIHKTIMRDE